jgi:predicted Abi (CAAX) family protease
MLNFLFDLSSLLAENALFYYTVSAQLFLRPQFATCRECTDLLYVQCSTVSSASVRHLQRMHCFIVCSVLNCFFGLSSSLAENARFYYTFSAQLFLRPQFVTCRECAVLLYVQCSTVSSASVRHLQRMHCFIICSVLICFVGFNVYVTQNNTVNHSPMRYSFLTENTI